MTNKEKYKTTEERDEAFHRFCKSMKDCNICPIGMELYRCAFAWLSLEAEEEKPLPCPFCGADGKITELKEGGFRAFCLKCLSASGAYSTKADAIAAWNRRAK